MSIQDLRPNSQDASAFYLENIYQLFADSNLPRAPTLSTFAKHPPFSPPRYAVWVNSLWFLSLVISLTCAIFATLISQWSRRYIRITRPPRCTPEKRARMRAFFADGVNKSHISWAIEGLPVMLHLSLFLFFLGLLIFLFNINHAVFGSVFWWIGLFTTVYSCFTFIPIFFHDSPFYAPDSTPAWLLYSGIQYLIVTVLLTFNRPFSHETQRRFLHLRNRYHGWFFGGLEKAADETASKRSTDIYLRILDWTMDALGEDATLEKNFEDIPGFFNSKLVNHRKQYFFAPSAKFQETLDGFLATTLSSKSVCESVRGYRLIICLNAAHAALGFVAVSRILDYISNVYQREAPQSVELGHCLRRWEHSKNSLINPKVRRIVAYIIVRASGRDDRWITLVKDEYGIPDGDFRDYLGHGDNALLAVLIHATRQAFRARSLQEGVLKSLSQINIHDTHSELQHSFCALWNEIVLEARKTGACSIPALILSEIRHPYIALHQGTDATPTMVPCTNNNDDILLEPFLHPLCNTERHRQNSTSSVSGPTSHVIIPLLPSIPSSCASKSGPTMTLGDFSDAAPHSTYVGSRSAPNRNSTPRQTDKGGVTIGILSSTDNTPHVHTPLSLSSSTDPVCDIEGQTTPVPSHIPLENWSTLGPDSTPRQADVAYNTASSFLYEDFTSSRPHTTLKHRSRLHGAGGYANY